MHGFIITRCPQDYFLLAWHKRQLTRVMFPWRLQDLLADSNPMVVANAVAALAEIHEVSGKDVFQITSQSLFKLLRALNECTEWGQVHTLLQYRHIAVTAGLHAVLGLRKMHSPVISMHKSTLSIVLHEVLTAQHLENLN